MQASLEFYFDFMSPYAYLAFQRLPALAARYSHSVIYKPVELGVLKLAAGNTGPPTREMPLKLAYAMTDIGRWAQRYGAPFSVRPGMSLDSDLLNKGTFYAIDRDEAEAYIRAAWAATYGHGQSMNDEAVIASVAGTLGWDSGEFREYLSSDVAKQRYAAGMDEARRNGIFGVPTMRLGKQLWWGNDRLDFVEEQLRLRASTAFGDGAIGHHSPA